MAELIRFPEHISHERAARRQRSFRAQLDAFTNESDRADKGTKRLKKVTKLARTRIPRPKTTP